METEEMPEHIAVIMDGNGRWAKEQGLSRSAGHKKGVQKLKKIIEIVNKLEIEHLTVFAFSTENWKRPKKEVDFLMRLFHRTFDNEVLDLHNSDVRIRVLGRRQGLPENIKAKIDEVVDLTNKNQGLNLNIALNYGGRSEIIDAAKSLAAKVKNGTVKLDDIDEEELSNELYTADIPDPELLIRPSGEKRISNFLLWQSAYAEFWFTDTYWPEFDKEELLEAIAEYQRRERRFGGLKEKDSR
ncbi:isoprenyl transferase [Acetohalobium arabaticum]|uniref:Isoprenyl transferase n=1 Tax=Acetohalobium arabaticum (strain ATCC 49924 / DSM 5501 / Z-7288) TaxID=574087 RepID=D9QRH3_ACEAZ|nr:isoprenyl transferase [Acetohalobium arabaticum]ADL13114.1 Undecaprenyl pyrophosphate synthetase [Acetohalobium arabaticum DSM 5501]